MKRWRRRSQDRGRSKRSLPGQSHRAWGPDSGGHAHWHRGDGKGRLRQRFKSPWKPSAPQVSWTRLICDEFVGVWILRLKLLAVRPSLPGDLILEFHLLCSAVCSPLRQSPRYGLDSRDERAPRRPPAAAPRPMNTALAMMSTTTRLAEDNRKTRKLYSRGSPTPQTLNAFLP